MAAVFAVSAISPPCARADDAAALLAKHKAFVGWQYGDGTFHFLRLTGAIAKSAGGSGDLDASFTTIRANTVYRTTRTNAASGLTSDEGFTGNVFWRTDANGFIRPIIGDAQKSLVSQQLLFTEATTAFDGTLQGQATVNGTVVSIVRISPASALPVDLYVDPATGAYKRVVFDPDGAFRATLDILSYIDGPNGKKFIGSYKAPNSTYTTTIKSVDAPSSIDVALFAPPKPTASWSFDPTKAPVPIDYNWYHAKRIYLRAKINGVDGTFILDSGNGIGIVLVQSFADKLHLAASKSGAAATVGGALATKTAKVDSIAFGANTLHNVAVTIEPAKLDADGLMGFDLFAGAVAHLDLDAQTLTLYDPATADIATLAAGGLPLTIDTSSGVPTVPMTVNGNIPVRAMLDTGNPYYVLFSSDLVEKDHVAMLHQPVVMPGLAGLELDECGALSEIAIGPVKYTHAPACESQSITSMGGHTILVGLDFLRHFGYWFDYPQSQIIMTQRTSSNP